MRIYLAVYISALLIAMLLVPVVSRLAKRFRLVDSPGPRKVHQEPVPRIGGVVFVISTLVLVVPFFFMDNTIGDSFRQSQKQLLVLLAAACFIFAVGLVDDLHPLRGYVKLLCLVVASLAICGSSTTFQSISFGQLFELDTRWLAWPLTVLWIVTITVGMNFIDGLDGLAGGVAAFVCATIFLLALWSGQVAMSMLMLVLLGSVTGFLFFNFYPAKIFMGDCGSMFLGFMIGAGSLVCQAKTATFVGLAIPLLVLGVPVFDAAFTMIRRTILYRRSIFSSEMGHVHHFMLDMGLPQLTAVIVIYALTAISASIGLFMLTTTGGWTIFLFAGGLFLVLVVLIYLGTARISETTKALKRNRSISKHIKQDKNSFENVQLRMRQAVTFDNWWQSICIMAKQMKFMDMNLCLYDNGHPAKRYFWKASEESPGNSAAEFVLPIYQEGPDLQSNLTLRASRNAFLEVTCRQVALMGRLLDEFPPPQELSDIKSDIKSVAKARKGKAACLPESINIMGIPVVPFVSYSDALECIETVVESDSKSFWIAINPQKCYRAWHDAELMEILNRADACICDGVGMSVASKILNGTGIRRCTGCDLFFETLSMASQKNWRVFLLGASPQSNANACARLEERYPGLKIVGRQDGYFKDSDRVIDEINASKAQLLFVAMGSPRQEFWICNNWQSLNVNFCMGVGGSFDVASGTLKRAPKFFQNTGTEFLFQLLTEPRKRWPRQKVYFPFMMTVVCKKIFGTVMLTEDDPEIPKKRIQTTVAPHAHHKSTKSEFI